jgi:hypothetical protein
MDWQHSPNLTIIYIYIIIIYIYILYIYIDNPSWAQFCPSKDFHHLQVILQVEPSRAMLGIMGPAGMRLCSDLTCGSCCHAGWFQRDVTVNGKKNVKNWIIWSQNHMAREQSSMTSYWGFRTPQFRESTFSPRLKLGFQTTTKPGCEPRQGPKI